MYYCFLQIGWIIFPIVFILSFYFSIQAAVCHVLFTVDVQFTGYSGSVDTQPAPASTTEQPSCAVCLGNVSLLV